MIKKLINPSCSSKTSSKILSNVPNKTEITKNQNSSCASKILSKIPKKIKHLFQKSSCASKIPAFFLLELMVTIALFAIIVSLSLLNDSILTKYQVHAEIDKLHAAILHGHRMALASGQEEFLIFDCKKNSYACAQRTESLGKGVQFGTCPEAKGPPSSPSNAIKNPVTFIHERISFNADGIMQPGTVYITDTKNRYAYALSIPVGHVSFIRKYVYKDSKWKLL